MFRKDEALSHTYTVHTVNVNKCTWHGCVQFRNCRLALPSACDRETKPAGCCKQYRASMRRHHAVCANTCPCLHLHLHLHAAAAAAAASRCATTHQQSGSSSPWLISSCSSSVRLGPQVPVPGPRAAPCRTAATAGPCGASAGALLPPAPPPAPPATAARRWRCCTRLRPAARTAGAAARPPRTARAGTAAAAAPSTSPRPARLRRPQGAQHQAPRSRALQQFLPSSRMSVARPCPAAGRCFQRHPRR